MLKVIEFIPFLNDGGAESLVRDYATLINKNEFEILILTTKHITTTANYNFIINNNIKIIQIFKNENLFVKIIRKYLGIIIIPFILKKIIRIEKPNLIHIHLNLLKYLKPLSVFLTKYKVKLLYTCHSRPSDCFAGNNNNEKKAAKMLIRKNNLRLVALHDDMKTELNHLFDVTNTIVIHNGIRIEKFKFIQESKSDIRKSLGLTNNAFVIGHVGRFTEQKNHSFIIDVFMELKKINDKSTLLLIGEGPLKGNINKKIVNNSLQDSVIILSNRSDIPQLMKSMDIFLFPSKSEGLGIVIVEALASNLKCFVSTQVPRAAYLNENVIPLGLSNDAKYWADAILSKNLKGEYHGDINLYDMKNVINKIEKVYSGNL